MKKHLKVFLMGYMVVLIVSTSYAYDIQTTHQNINGAAARQSNLNIVLESRLGIQKGLKYILTKDGDKRTIEEWIQEGGKLEDVPNCRSKYHFHDPTKAFDSAGLSNPAINIWCINWSNYSSASWAQHQNNEWSWQKTRGYFYQALTASDKTIREKNLANTFQSIGQVMHLFEDMSVPEHTKNDLRKTQIKEATS
jgi:hypothetical protein